MKDANEACALGSGRWMLRGRPRIRPEEARPPRRCTACTLSLQNSQRAKFSPRAAADRRKRQRLLTRDARHAECYHDICRISPTSFNITGPFLQAERSQPLPPPLRPPSRRIEAPARCRQHRRFREAAVRADASSSTSAARGRRKVPGDH